MKDYTITFDQLKKDSDGTGPHTFDVMSDIFTAPFTGVYLINGKEWRLIAGDRVDLKNRLVNGMRPDGQ